MKRLFKTIRRVNPIEGFCENHDNRLLEREYDIDLDRELQAGRGPVYRLEREVGDDE